MMPFTRVALVGFCAVLAAGCVSSGTHQQALAELERARTEAARTAADLDSYKKQAAAEAETFRKKSAQDIAALKEDKARLAADLQAAKASAAEALDQADKSLAAEQEGRRDIESQVKKLQDRSEKLQQTLSEASTRAATLEKDKEQLAAALTEARDQGKELATKLATEQVKVSILREDKQRLLSGTTTAREEIARMQVTLQQQEERLKTVEAEKAKQEQELAARDAGTLRLLSRTQEDFAKSFEADMVKGDILITPNRDRVTISIADRLLFESGQGRIKPAGLKILNLVAEIIKTVPDKQVRVEGHTDNAPIGDNLRDKLPTNWELSTLHAARVVRYLIEQGRVDQSMLSAVGYAGTKPAAGNDMEVGRKANRRIDITLFTKDPADIVGR
jgi:chemotaxis protein MotB